MEPNTNVSVRLSPKTRLNQALKKAGVKDLATVSKLTVSGTLDYDDFKYIRKKMAEPLQELDMGKATVGRNKIPNHAFHDCYGLTSVVIPDSVIKIGDFAFCDCSSLIRIIIPESVGKIGFLAFDNCSALTAITVSSDNPAYKSESGVLFNKNKTELIVYPKRRQGDYIIPDSVVEIDTRAFADCTGLTSITIPGSVTTIGFCAFGGCTGLTSVLVPDSVTKIRGFAFVNCTGLTYFAIPDSATEIGYGAFDGCPAVFSVHPDNPVFESENGKLMIKF